MKKLLLSFATFFLLTSVIMAQNEQGKQIPKQKSEQQKQPALSECCLMKKGKMVHYKDGKETPITKDMDMSGIKVMPDGTCKMKDGKSMKLKEGECCDTKGVIHKDCGKLMKKG